MANRKVGIRRWEGNVRRATRVWVKEHELVPSLCAYASRGLDDRAVEMLPRLDLIVERTTLREAVLGHLGKHRAAYAGYGRMMGRGFERRLLVVTVGPGGEYRACAAAVSTDGLGAWEVEEDQGVGSVVAMLQEGLRS